MLKGKEVILDSITFSDDEAQDLIVVLKYAINNGIGYGHYLSTDPEYIAAERMRCAYFRRIQKLLIQSIKRKRKLVSK